MQIGDYGNIQSLDEKNLAYLTWQLSKYIIMNFAAVVYSQTTEVHIPNSVKIGAIFAPFWILLALDCKGCRQIERVQTFA